MRRALKEHLKLLMGWVCQNRTRMERIVSGRGTPGTMAAPTQAGNNDANIGLRLDYGEIFKKDGNTYRRVNLQVNKGAKDPTLKAMASLNSHEIWSHADILIESEQVDATAATVGGSSGKEVPTTSETAGQKISAQAEPTKPDSSVQENPVGDKTVKFFADLEVNLKG